MNQSSRQNPNNQQPEWKKLLNLFLLLGFIGSMIGIGVCAATGKVEYSIVLFGVCFLFIGIIALMSIKLTDRNAWVILFPVVGFCIAALAIYHIKNPMVDIWEYGLLTGTGMMIFLALVMGLSTPIYRAYINKKYTVTVQAACVELKEDFTRSDSAKGPVMIPVYCPVYHFTYRGREYTVCEDDFYSNMGVPKVGEIRELLINPMKPEEFYAKKRGSFLGNLLFIIVALIIGGAMFFAYYSTYVVKK